MQLCGQLPNLMAKYVFGMVRVVFSLRVPFLPSSKKFCATLPVGLRQNSTGFDLGVLQRKPQLRPVNWVKCGRTFAITVLHDMESSLEEYPARESPVLPTGRIRHDHYSQQVIVVLVDMTYLAGNNLRQVLVYPGTQAMPVSELLDIDHANSHSSWGFGG
jgi:hypothetical protein